MADLHGIVYKNITSKPL